MTVKRPAAGLILASQSPRRVELLKQLVADFEVMPSQIEEIFSPDLSPLANAADLAGRKAREVAQRRPGQFVLGADTIVVLAGRIIGKPADEEDARAILSGLSGKSHEVITAVALAVPGGTVDTAEVVSRVRFRPLPEKTIADYIATHEPMDKAGAYAIQGHGAALIEGHEGSFSNIVGLPLAATHQLLRRAGFPLLSPRPPGERA